MNCQKIDELMPLFVGGDLDGSEESSIMSHLRHCADCRSSEDKFRQAMIIVRGFGPPDFGDHVYADIRRRVFTEIDDAARASAFSNLVGLFRPQYRWAMAAVLLLAVTTFIASRLDQPNPDLRGGDSFPTDPPTIASNVEQPLSVPTREIDRAADSLADIRPRQPHQSAKASFNKRFGRNIARRDDRKTPAPSPAPNGVAALTKNTSESPPLRIEMQTKDPNIRIIWFTKQSNQ